MKFGFILPHLLSPISDVTTIRASARLAEEIGFDSIWLTDHILMPEEYVQYGKGTEMLVTAAYVAGITQRIGLGLSVLILPMRNPLVAAKQIASIIHLADREFIVGIGVGWNRDEYRFMNADFERRGKRVDEYIDIMRTLWSEDQPEHEGTHTFSDVLFAPKPDPLPPIWIGGSSDAALNRAARLGNGYHPNMPTTVADYATMIQRIRDMSEGRPVTMSVRITLDVRGGTAEVIDTLSQLEDVGLEYPVVNLKHDSLDDLLRSMSRFGRDVIPTFN